MESVIVRRATGADAAAILETHRAAVRGIAAAFYEADIIEDWAPAVTPDRIAALARRIADGEEVPVVALIDGRVVGFGSIDPARSEVRAVYVAPSHSRQGVGGIVLQELERLARTLGLSALCLDASLNAEGFYRTHGYAGEERGHHTLRSGRTMPCVRMRKTLGPAIGSDR